MNTDQINALSPGPELDKAVANAIGGTLVRYIDDYDQDAHLIDHGNDGKLQGIDFPGQSTGFHSRFYPSHYLEAAFFAAEKVRLFEKSSLGWDGTDYVVTEWDSPPDSLYAYGAAPTPALAICRAILTLTTANN